MRCVRALLVLPALLLVPVAAATGPATTLYWGPTSQRLHQVQLNAFVYVHGARVTDFAYYADYHGDSRDCAKLDGQGTRVYPRARIVHGAFRVARVQNGSPRDVVRDLHGRVSGRLVIGSFSETLAVRDPALHREIHCTTGTVKFRATRHPARPGT